MIRKVALLFTLCWLLAAPVFANEVPEKTTVQVTGNSQKEVTPDTASITIAINSMNSSLEQAKNDNIQKANQVLGKLREEGLTDQQIKTDTYYIDPVYNYDKDSLPTLKGYRVNNGIEVQVPIEKVGIVVNDVISAGANEIRSIRFEKQDETEAKNEALREAVGDALKKAEIIASSLNRKIAKVKLVNESNVFYHPVMLESRAFKAAGADAAVPNIPAGKVTIGATVQVTVELE